MIPVRAGLLFVVIDDSLVDLVCLAHAQTFERCLQVAGARNTRAPQTPGLRSTESRTNKPSVREKLATVEKSNKKVPTCLSMTNQ